MIFSPDDSFETGCAARVLGCGGLGKCAVVDAQAKDVDAYIWFAASKGSPCGAGTSGKLSSTLGFEKRNSPLLSKSRSEFIDAVASVPPRPAAMEQILRVNQGHEGVQR